MNIAAKYEYTGKRITFAPKDLRFTIGNVACTVPASRLKMKYYNNLRPGQGKMKIGSSGAYTGTLRKTLKIKASEIVYQGHNNKGWMVYRKSKTGLRNWKKYYGCKTGEPTYKLSLNNGREIYTYSKSEWKRLKRCGLKDRGIAFRSDPNGRGHYLAVSSQIKSKKWNGTTLWMSNYKSMTEATQHMKADKNYKSLIMYTTVGHLTKVK